MASNPIGRNYLPNIRAKRDAWLTATYSPALAQYGSLFNLTPEENNTVLDAADEFLYQQRYDAALAAFGKQVTAFTNAADSSNPRTPLIRPVFAPPTPPTARVAVPLNGYFSFIVKLNDDKILGHDKLTPSIKTALGLDSLDESDEKSIKIDRLEAKSGGEIIVHFHLLGHRAVEIEMQRSSEPGATQSAQSAFDSFDDVRPNKVEGQTESRGYRARFVLSKSETGDWSDWSFASTLP